MEYHVGLGVRSIEDVLPEKYTIFNTFWESHEKNSKCRLEDKSWHILEI